MKIWKREFDVNLLVLFAALMIVAVVMTYIIADYTNRQRIETVKIEYEYKISRIITETENFFDNYSRALTYLDVARSDLKDALYYTDIANHSISEAIYGIAYNRSEVALYYFNISNREFRISIPYLIKSMNNTEDVGLINLIELYINYTRVAINMTEIGKNMSTTLSSAAKYYSKGEASNGNSMMTTFEELKNDYRQHEILFNRYLIEIKNFYGIRE
jgi:hypothetical protein